MTGLYRESAVVLRTFDLGETDRIITMLTRQRGKRRGVAKGVRRPGSRFGARLQPGTYVAIQMYEGRSELHTITQVETIDRWANVTSDLERLTQAAEMLEVIDQLVPDGAADPRLLDMLVGAMRTLDETGAQLIVPAFMFKLLAHEGLRPEIDVCANCGSDSYPAAFDLAAGGLLCRSCRSGTSVTPDAVELLRQVLGGQLSAALAAPVTPAVLELDQLASDAMEAHLERRLRSRGVARQL